MTVMIGRKPRPRRLTSSRRSPAVAARKAILRRVHRQLLRKLQALVPSLPDRRCTNMRQPDAVEIIYATVRYINQLKASVVARVRAGTLPESALAHYHIDMETMMRQMHTNSTHQNSAAAPFLYPAINCVQENAQCINSEPPVHQRHQDRQAPKKPWW